MGSTDECRKKSFHYFMETVISQKKKKKNAPTFGLTQYCAVDPRVCGTEFVCGNTGVPKATLKISTDGFNWLLKDNFFSKISNCSHDFFPCLFLLLSFSTSFWPTIMVGISAFWVNGEALKQGKGQLSWPSWVLISKRFWGVRAMNGKPRKVISSLLLSTRSRCGWFLLRNQNNSSLFRFFIIFLFGYSWYVDNLAVLVMMKERKEFVLSWWLPCSNLE